MKTVMLAAAALLAWIAGAQAAPPDRVVMAQSYETMIWAPVYVARKLGYFGDDGIDLDVVVVKSGPAALTDVTTGSAQIAMGFPATPIQAISKGLDVMIFAELSNQFIAELMLRGDVAERLHVDANSPIDRRMAALKGLTIAMNGAGSANDYLLKRIIGEAGMRHDTDVTITAIAAPAAILAALDQKRLDGFVATPPLNVVAMHDHGAVQLTTSRPANTGRSPA